MVVNCTLSLECSRLPAWQGVGAEVSQPPCGLNQAVVNTMLNAARTSQGFARWTPDQAKYPASSRLIRSIPSATSQMRSTFRIKARPVIPSARLPLEVSASWTDETESGLGNAAIAMGYVRQSQSLTYMRTARAALGPIDGLMSRWRTGTNEMIMASPISTYPGRTGAPVIKRLPVLTATERLGSVRGDAPSMPTGLH